jgi:putative ABC transport system substrate-binding protein
VERYSGEGRPEGFADLARGVVNRNPDVIVVANDAIAQAAHAADDAIPIVLITGGDPIRTGQATSLARPGGSITGVTVEEGSEIGGKRLQIVKEAVPSASRVAYLDVGKYWEGDARSYREPSRQLQISMVGMLLQESNPPEIQRVFAETAQDRPDAIIVNGRADLTAHHQLIIELANISRLPAIYAWRDYVEAGGLMAYGADLGELGRRAASDVHEILNGAKPGDIPIYQPTKFEFLINLNAAKALGLTALPVATAAQQPGKVWRIGHVATSTPEIGGIFAQALEQRLADLGYVQGRNIALLHRFAGSQQDKILQEVIMSLVPQIDLLARNLILVTHNTQELARVPGLRFEDWQT